MDFENVDDGIEAILKGARMLHRMDDYDVEFTDFLESNYGVVDIYYILNWGYFICHSVDFIYDGIS